MMPEAILPLLVLLPLLSVLVAVALPSGAGRWLAVICLAILALLLWPLTTAVLAQGGVEHVLAGVALPLGIRLSVDGFGLLMLWLVEVVMLAATAHAWGDRARGGSGLFWPAWLGLLAGLNALLISTDLFNLYVGLEVLTLSAVALVASGGGREAVWAALRYLLLGMLASLAYLLGVALIYAMTGTLDMTAVGLSSRSDPTVALALALMVAGLLLKSAIFPLHGWLPPAHASAPGAVSALLSALVVKASLYVLYRLWFWAEPPLSLIAAGQVLALLGAGALVAGSVLAFRQHRLKRLVAYSTVAQLGYLMLVFAVPTAAAWQGTVYHLLSHGLAKAAMFLAAGNLLVGLGSDRMDRLAGADARLPISVFAFGLAAVSLIGLPPSGGFIAKWLLLTAVWRPEHAFWAVLLLLGSLLSAAYLFRALARMFSRPLAGAPDAGRPVPRLAETAALALALAAIVAGFVPALVLPAVVVPPGFGSSP
ncbi:MAG: proton-conducting transporter membrane subunit [Xanthomonadaceae bacterium]|nr:proton-conducting transporter membrane subunit [Xanthomonadaceae bacterium]